MADERDRLALALHSIRAGCLVDYPGDPVRPGDDSRTHVKDARRLIAAGFGDVTALTAEVARLREAYEATEAMLGFHAGSLPTVSNQPDDPYFVALMRYVNARAVLDVRP